MGFRLTLRSLLLGIFLSAIMGFLCPFVEVFNWTCDYAIPPPPIGVMFLLFLILLFNGFLKKYFPKKAFSSGELVAVYVMAMVSAPFSSFGLVQFLIPSIGDLKYFSRIELHWDKFLPYLPRYLYLQDEEAIRGFFDGGTKIPWQSWLMPLINWLLFACALYFLFWCIAVIFRKQWVENEKLTFPLVILPLEMLREPEEGHIFNSFLRHPLTLTGMALAMLSQISYGIYHIKPSIPPFVLLHNNLMRFFPYPPWSAMQWFEISLYPSFLGIAYLVSSEIAFSCWFFYLMGKIELVIGSAFGFSAGRESGFWARFPGLEEQTLGAFLALFGLICWSGRHHIKSVISKALGKGKEIDDSSEPLSYRVAFFGALISFSFLLFWLMRAGLSLFYSLFFVFVFLVFSLVLSRMRAEGGLTWIHVPDHPSNIAVSALGVSGVGERNLTILSALKFLEVDGRGYLMPSLVEGLKFADPQAKKGWIFSLAIWLAIIACILVAVPTTLHLYYLHGAGSAKADRWRVESGVWAFRELASWLNVPPQPNPQRFAYSAIGLIFTLFLGFMRIRFPWWPFHPLGYAVSNTMSMNFLWFSFFWGWLFKTTALKVGGLKTYRKALPFFLGLIMGEVIGNGFWAILQAIFGFHGFAYNPGTP
ncbi:MAG: DUF6785 family protein [bacterium]